MNGLDRFILFFSLLTISTAALLAYLSAIIFTTPAPLSLLQILPGIFVMVLAAILALAGIFLLLLAINDVHHYNAVQKKMREIDLAKQRRQAGILKRRPGKLPEYRYRPRRTSIRQPSTEDLDGYNEE